MNGEWWQSDEGLSLVELSVAALILGFVLAMVGSALLMASRTEVSTAADTESLTALRFARESLERDVRQADEIRDTSTTSSLEIWLDADSDGIVRSGEVVVWSFETAPAGGSNLVRTVTDTGERWVAAEGLVTPGGGYDPFTDGTAAPGSSTTLLTVTLHAEAVPGVGEIETITTRIHLRNK